MMGRRQAGKGLIPGSSGGKDLAVGVKSSTRLVCSGTLEHYICGGGAGDLDS